MKRIYEYTLNEKKYKNKIIKKLNMIGFILSYIICVSMISSLMASDTLLNLNDSNIVMKIVALVILVIVVNLTLKTIFDIIKRKFTTIETLQCKLELNDDGLEYTDNNINLKCKYTDITGLVSLFGGDSLGFSQAENVERSSVEVLGNGIGHSLETIFREGEKKQHRMVKNTKLLFKIPMYCDDAINDIQQKTGREVEYYTN